MASETNLTDVERAINQLQGVLNENYLAAEKIMALRTPNTSELKAILVKIDKSYDELVGAMASARKDTEAIVAVTQNQHEFNLRKKEWFQLWITHHLPLLLFPNHLPLLPGRQALCLPALPGILLDLPGVLLIV